MSEENGNLPASPIDNAQYDSCSLNGDLTGLTKREHFAGLAMQGLLASGSYTDLIHCSVSYADALLAELDK